MLLWITLTRDSLSSILKMKKLSLKASCLCGGIQLKTNGYHRNIQNCHCIQCMKTHGHYAAYTNVEEQNIKFIKNFISFLILVIVLSGCAINKNKTFKHDTPLIKEDIQKIGREEVM